MANQPTLSQKYQEVASNLVEVTSTLGRIEERVGIFIEKIHSLERKIDHHTENCPVKCQFADVASRVRVLESTDGKDIKEWVKDLRAECLEDIRALQASDSKTADLIHSIQLEQQAIKAVTSQGENKWKTIGWIVLNICVPIAWVTIASFILYYLGITAPPIP